jgi:hypothetical protein
MCEPSVASDLGATIAGFDENPLVHFETFCSYPRMPKCAIFIEDHVSMTSFWTQT